MEFKEENAYQDALKTVKEGVLNYKNRNRVNVLIPEFKSKATVGYSVDAIINQLDKVVNSQIDETGTVKPVVDCLKSGAIRGIVGVVGCSNARVPSNKSHITVMTELIKNDILVVSTGCATKNGLMDKEEGKKIAGKGLATVCKLVDIPPVLHMGSCVDCCRILDVASALANYTGLDICDLPIAGSAPE